MTGIDSLTSDGLRSLDTASLTEASQGEHAVVWALWQAQFVINQTHQARLVPKTSVITFKFHQGIYVCNGELYTT